MRCWFLLWLVWRFCWPADFRAGKAMWVQYQRIGARAGDQAPTGLTGGVRASGQRGAEQPARRAGDDCHTAVEIEPVHTVFPSETRYLLATVPWRECRIGVLPEQGLVQVVSRFSSG